MTNVNKLIGINLPSGPAYRDISEFDQFNPFSGIPVSDGLQISWFGSGKFGSPMKNYSNSAFKITVTGSPAVKDSYVQVSDGNYYSLGMPAGSDLAKAKEVTIITVAANLSSSADAWVLSNYGGNNSESSDSILYRKDMKCETYGSYNGGLASVLNDTSKAGAQGSTLICAAVMKEKSQSNIVYQSATDDLGKTNRDFAVGSRAINATRNYLIGARHGMSGNGASNVSIVLAYSRALTDGEILLLSRFIRNDMGVKFGIW